MDTVMDTFGKQLKDEREQRNVALDEISRSTKIRVRYLEALEQGQHERLPGIVFAKGYVRAYAETIGADPDRLVRAYVEEQRALGRLETEASQEQVLKALAVAVEDRQGLGVRRAKSVLIAFFVLVMISAVFWFGVRPLLNREPVAATDTAAPVEVATPPAKIASAIPLQPAPVESESTTDDAVLKSLSPVADTTALETPDPVTETPAPVTPQPIAESPIPERVEATAVPVATTTLTIPDHGVGTAVEQRALVGESSTFENGTQVVFWTRVLGGEAGRTVRHVWSHDGNVTATIELPIGAAHWRTYSKQTLRGSGQWSVEAQDESGNVLARRTFATSPS